VAVFGVAFLAIVGVAAAAVVWTGTRTYYVGLDGEQVAIFRGKPGGVLWIQPELAETTELTADQVPAASRQDVAAGREEPSLESARRYVDNLVEQYERTTTTTTSTTSTTTTTVVPPEPAAPATLVPPATP
jgi:PPM family protein phosphatase